MTGSPAADLVGQSVDDYQIASRLGGGGMGVVYEGKAKDGRRVAIKTLKAAFANDKELVGRFLGEARALKAISHRAMVQILAIGQLDDGTHYMVMEFLEGRSFEDVIEHGAPLDVREVMTWMVEVLDALETVHAAGVIHRDLKPSNLFLARTGVGAQVKLIDFGIAKHFGKSGKDAPKTLVSAIVGTPDYMSPEQVNGQEVTAASDLYALGCVMFEMLTGELPFDEESSVRKMLMHVEQPAPRVSSRVSVPEAVDDLIAWMMQKDPSQRPPTARALKERIVEVMGETLGGSGPVPTRQVKSLPAREDRTLLSKVGDLHSSPAATELALPAVKNGRPLPGRSITSELPLAAAPDRTVIGQPPLSPGGLEPERTVIGADPTVIASDRTVIGPEPQAPGRERAWADGPAPFKAAADRTLRSEGWPAAALLDPPTALLDPAARPPDLLDGPTALDLHTALPDTAVPDAAGAVTDKPVRVRRRTEPGRKRGQVVVPVWALAVGAVTLLALVLLVIVRITRGAPAPQPPVAAPAPATQAAATGPAATPATPTPDAVGETKPSSPPDQPPPKRPKRAGTLPTRKKPPRHH